MTSIQDLTNGRWPDLLSHFCGLTTQQLSDKHQSCPFCGGKDRYRFDDQGGNGSWFCNQCGGKDQSGGAGSGMDLLLRKTGWSYPEACSRIQAHLGLIPSAPTKGAEHIWHYNDTFIVCRFPGKKIRPLWWDGIAWRWKAPPEPRPIYRLQDLLAKPGKPALICEGEKSVDAAAALFPAIPCIGWASGCKAFTKTDWSPIAGRRCVLWPDNDDVGREAMAKLAPVLLRAGATEVTIVSPPADAAEGWDLADCTWSAAEVGAYIKANSSAPITLPAEQPELTPEPEGDLDPEPLPASNAYFRCLGFDGDHYYYQPDKTGQVVRLARASHTSTNLVSIAPLSYWEALYPNKTGVNWTAAASSMFQQCADVGVYNPTLVRGRGAWWDNNRSVLHLGGCIIMDGQARSSTQPLSNSRFIYQRLASIEGPAVTDPLPLEQAQQICALAQRFLWETDASGLLLAGWVTLAPICGALEWRPHAWLTAGAGSGKSTVLDDFMAPLLGDMSLIVAGTTTEAGIRQRLRADALPVVFDEAESNERTDQQRMQSILSLARVASSESRANLLKGTPDGNTQSFTIRSMFFMSSIATALKQGADKTRFAQLTLRNPKDVITDTEERTRQWQQLSRDLEKTINDEVGRRLQGRTVSLIPTIRKSIDVFTEVAANHFDSQRLGDQYGTLLAGAWSLMSNEPVTKAQAEDLVAKHRWESYSQNTEKTDEQACLETILQHQVRVEADNKTLTRSLGELVELASMIKNEIDISRSQAEAALGRQGLKVDNGDLLVSNSAQQIASILRDTAWGNCWPTVLVRLTGAAKVEPTYFKGVGSTSRAVRVPLAENL